MRPVLRIESAEILQSVVGVNAAKDDPTSAHLTLGVSFMPKRIKIKKKKKGEKTDRTQKGGKEVGMPKGGKQAALGSYRESKE